MYLAQPHAELNKTVTAVGGGGGCEGVRVPLLLLRDPTIQDTNIFSKLSEAREQTHQSLNMNRHQNQQYKILPHFIDGFKLFLIIHSFVPGYPHQERQEGFESHVSQSCKF